MESKAKIYFMELAMSGIYHCQINIGFIRILKQCFPEISKIIFIAEKKHIMSCSHYLINENIDFKPFFFPEVNLKTLLLRDFLGVFHAVMTLFKTKRDDIIFFSYVLPFTHIAIIIYSFFFKRRIFICLHGQMEAFIPFSPLRMTKYYFKITTALYKIDFNSYYIVLGEPIFKKIERLFGRKVKVIVIDHPYDFDHTLFASNQKPYPICMGQIGVGDSGKGTQNIFLLAERMKKYILEGKLELTIIGKLNPNLAKYDNNLVDYFTYPLNDEDFKNRVAALHYSLFFRDNSHGEAVASGSFFDTIKYSKPYISLNNSFVRYYSERFPGTGFICDSIDDMVHIIQKILEDKEELSYYDAIERITDMKKDLSIINIAETFKKQL